MAKYSVILVKDNKRVGSFHPPEKLFEKLEKEVEPYRTLIVQPKAVRCIETMEVFKSARAAAKALLYRCITNSHHADTKIKTACKTGKELFGFHWEFVED